MNEVFSLQGIKSLWTYIACTLLAAVTPTQQFVGAVILMCFFNIWCGMRADGVTNFSACKNFSWRKVSKAFVELIMFLVIIELIAIVTAQMGDSTEGLYACKAAGYCIVYCYFDNGLKNLCKAYPTSKGLWYIYLFVHLDFRRLLHIDSLMEKYDEHLQKQQDGSYKSDI